MAKPITETLARLHEGAFLDNASEEFAKLVRVGIEGVPLLLGAFK